MSAATANQLALKLWRDDTLSKHPKGACSGCHGPNFFDLARIGTTEADILRRATNDGATAAEAAALAQAVKDLRQSQGLPTQNARSFRPFQPGGAVLLPNLNDGWNLAAVKRDIAFAQNVAKLLPTLTGTTRIASVAQAQKARDEMLDIAKGTNHGGANPSLIQLRDLPVGIDFPRWSADKFHDAKAEGTFNDWIADVAFVPLPERKAEWEALQSKYLANPSSENFWTMYAAVDSMLKLATPLGPCKASDVSRCSTARYTLKVKFRTTLIGQHLLRMDALGRRHEFVDGPLAFSYLDENPAFNAVAKEKWNNRSFLPSDFWLMGSVFGRVSLKVDGLGPNGTLGDVATALGLPAFVVDSIDTNRDPSLERQDIQKSWMWMGFTMEPSFARMEPSFSTKVGEYMVGALDDGRLFNHAAFMTHMRLLAASFLPEAATTADAKSPTGVKRIPNDRLHELTNYSYFVGYGRNVLGGYNLWGESLSTKGVPVPQALKDTSSKLWSTMVSNGMRMTTLLLIDELEKRPAQINAKWRATALSLINESGVDQWAGVVSMTEHWAKFQPEHAAADLELRKRLAAAVRYAGPGLQ